MALRRGLTIIELLVTIAIILIVAAIISVVVVKLRKVVKSFEEQRAMLVGHGGYAKA